MLKNCSLLIFIFLIVFFQSVKAQTLERPEKESMMIGDPVSVLYNATGWILQDNGEWEGRNNVIAHKNNELNKSKKGPAKTGTENFSKLELRQVILENDKVYSVLLVYYSEGYYEYPKINQNWVQFGSVKYYVFREEVLSRVFPEGFRYNHPKVVNLNLICSGKIIDYDEKTYLFKIQNAIREATYLNQESVYTTLLAVLPVEIKNEKSVRFKFIEVLNKVDVYGKYLRSVNWPKLFETSYFESDFQDFYDFIELASPVQAGKMADSAFVMKYFHSGMKKSEEKNYPGAIVDFTKALSSNSQTINRSLVLLNRGITKYYAKDFQGAVKDLTAVISDSSNKALHPEIYNKSLHYRGLSHFENQEYYAACDDWTEASDNGYAEVKNYIDKVCLKKDYEVKQLSKIFRFYLKKGMKKMEDSLYVKAIVKFNKAEARQPENNFFPLYYHRGVSHYRLNDWIAAEQDLSRSVRIKPGKYSQFYPLWADALYYLGKVGLFNKDTIQGCEKINMAIAAGSTLPDENLIKMCTPRETGILQKPDSTGFENNFRQGIQYFRQADYYESLKYLKKACELYPEHSDPTLWYYLALARHHTDDWLSAVEYFTKAYDILKKTNHNDELIPAVLYNRGISKFYLQDLKGACEDWQRSVNAGLADEPSIETIRRNCK